MFENIHASSKRVQTNYSKSIKTIEDLLEHTILDIETGCREWIHGKTQEGYGRATYQGQPIDVHRWAWILTHPNEALKQSNFICHTCDNPPCLEPEHLFLGTVLLNNQDSKKKGRRAHQKLIACPNGHPKIEENILRSKRKDGRNRIECRLCNKDACIKRYYEKTYGVKVEKTDKGTWRRN